MNLPPGHETIRENPTWKELLPKRKRMFPPPTVVGQYVALVLVIDKITSLPIQGYAKTPLEGLKVFEIRSYLDIVENLWDYTNANGYQVLVDDESDLEYIAKLFVRENRESWSETWRGLYNGEEIEVGKYSLEFRVRPGKQSYFLKIGGLEHRQKLIIGSLGEWSTHKLTKTLRISQRLDSPAGRAQTLLDLSYKIALSMGNFLPSDIYSLMNQYDRYTKGYKLLETLQAYTPPEVEQLAYECCQHTHWVEFLKHGYFPNLIDIDSNMFYLWAETKVISPKDIRKWKKVEDHSEFLLALENGPLTSYQDSQERMKPVMGFFSADVEIFPCTKTCIQIKNLHGVGRRPRFITLQEILHILERNKGKVKVISGYLGYSDASPPGQMVAEHIWRYRNHNNRENKVTTYLIKQGAARDVGRLFQKGNRISDLDESGEPIFDWWRSSNFQAEVYATALAIARVQLDKSMDYFGEDKVIYVSTDGFGLDGTHLTQPQKDFLKKGNDLGGLRIQHQGQGWIINSDLYQIKEGSDLILIGNPTVELEKYLKENPEGRRIETLQDTMVQLSETYSDRGFSRLELVGRSSSEPKVYDLSRLNPGRWMKERIRNNLELTTRQFTTLPKDVDIANILDSEMDIPLEMEEPTSF